MARIRSLHPKQWTDEEFVALTPFARLLCLAIRNEADDQGIFEWKPTAIKMRLFPADNVNVADLLYELTEHKQITKYKVDGRIYGLIRNFTKYQRPKKPNSLYPKPEELRTAPSSINGSTEPVPQKEEQAVQRKEEGGKEKRNVGSKRHKSDYTAQFETFWTSYPTDPGMSKSEAFKEWQRLDEDDQQKATDGIPGLKTWIVKQGKDYRTLHARTYLSQRRFDGFVTAAKKATEFAGSKVYVQYGTDPGDAWERWYRAQGKMPPRDTKGGWYFPTEYPERAGAAPS